MSGQTSPPGDTFEERWPDDVAEANWLAAPWTPIVLGGLAGLFGAPVLLVSLALRWFPMSVIVWLGLLVLLTLAVRASSGRSQRGLGRLWRLVAWLGAVAVLGYLIGLATIVLCGGASCSPTFPMDDGQPVAAVVVFALSVGGSIVAAMGVVRLGRRLAAGPAEATDRMR